MIVGFRFGVWCSMPLSTIFQLYHYKRGSNSQL